MNPFSIAFVLFLLLLVLSEKGTAFMNVTAKDSGTVKYVVEQWSTLAMLYGQVYSVPSSVLLAIIAVESEGEPGATGSAGEKGLMQVTRIALKEINQVEGTAIPFDSLDDPQVNIKVGAAYLARCKSVLRDLDLAIQGYNAGYPAVLSDSGRSVSYRLKVRLTEDKITELFTA